MILVSAVSNKVNGSLCMHVLTKSYLGSTRLKMMKQLKKFKSCKLKEVFSAYMRPNSKKSYTAHGKRVQHIMQLMPVFMLVLHNSTLLMQDYKAETMTVCGISLIWYLISRVVFPSRSTTTRKR